MPENAPALAPAQEIVITMLSAGSTLSDAAQAAGVHRNTIANWRRTQPLFQNALAAAHYDRALHWRDLAEENAVLAIQTIRGLLADPDAPPSIRLKAALAILKKATTPPPAPPPIAPGASPLCTPPELETVHNSAQPYRRPFPKVGRNEPCFCGSGRKYKQCCLQNAAFSTLVGDSSSSGFAASLSTSYGPAAP